MKSNRLTIVIILFLCFFNSDYPFTLSFLGKISNTGLFTNLIVFLSVIIVFVNFSHLFKEFKYWMIIVLSLLLSLIIQSLIQYNKLFIYPHVFYKILVPFVFFASYILALKVKANYIDIFSKFIIFFYFFNLFVLGWVRFYSPLNLYAVDPIIGGAGDSRVFHAKVVYFLILPFLYYSSKYIAEKKKKFLFVSLILGLIILFQNHRSVWVTGIFTLLTLLLLLKKSMNSSKYFSRGLFISSFAISIIIILLIIFEDSVIFSERFSDIINFSTQGTGLWRYNQVDAYLPIIYENILWGLRFGGFELNLLGPGASYFLSGTGHHFHNGYIDIVFYHGILGLILLYGLIIYIAIEIFKKKCKSINDVITIAFILGALPFSFAYRIPFSYWGLAGVMAANSLENNSVNKEK